MAMFLKYMYAKTQEIDLNLSFDKEAKEFISFHTKIAKNLSKTRLYI